MTHNTREVEEVLETYLTGTSIHEHFRQVQRRITSHWDGLNWDALDKVSKQRYDGVAMELRLEILPHFHHQLQKARQDWLREEIVKLEGMKKPTSFTGSENAQIESVFFKHEKGYNQALQTIIDRYHSEIDQDKK